MDLSGLSDSPARTWGEDVRCRCGSLARVSSGLCVSCLLRTALGNSESETEDFDSLLASVNVPDRDWQLGNYRILEEVGRGGMGVIYRARHTPSERIVALKRVLSYHSDSGETLARFRREAAAAASLDHPNILPIYDVGVTEDGLPFFSMKFAGGGSLLENIKSFRDNPRQCVDLLAKVSRALDHAHRKGILHRDLKPGNILLDARGEPLVTDFGLAKWLDTANDFTRTLTVFGTPGYIAPEQSENAAAKLTPAVDVYSLGAILFELLTGRPPFVGEHAISVIRQAAESTAPRLRSINPRLDRDLDTICARCLEREPHMRYPSAADLAEDLERWLEGRPIQARPISPVGRLYRWSRRNPVLGVTMLTCLLLGTAIIARQLQNWRLGQRIREAELDRNTVGVLPILNVDTATLDYGWTVGFARALQNSMSEVGKARVIAATPEDAATGSFRKSGLRTVLSGSKRTTDAGTTLSIQLADSNGDLLLHKTVVLSERPTEDIGAAVYSVLTMRDWSNLITAKTDPALRNRQTRELIAAGRELGFHHTVLDFDRARSCFEKALAIEPRSALAHAYLASAAAARTHYVNDTNLLAYAEREAEEAFRLAPDSGETLRVLAGVDYQRGQFRKALQIAFHAAESSAPNAMSFALLGMIHNELGQPHRALRWFELARNCEGNHGDYDSDLGDCWAALGDDGHARKYYQRATDLHPERSRGWIGIARLFLLNGDFAAARKVIRQNQNADQESIDRAQIAAQVEFLARNFAEAQRLYADLSKNDPDGGGNFYGGIGYESALGRIAVAERRPTNARAILGNCLEKELRLLDHADDNPDILYRVSAIESSMGEHESALQHLRAAVDAGWIDYRSLSLDPRFDEIASDTRFQSLLGQLKLKTEDLRRTANSESN